MLQSLLAEKMQRDDLSARDAARQIGVSHTTVIRIMQGDVPNIENLVAISQWLGISVGTALGVESGQASDVASSVAMIIEAEPRMRTLLEGIVRDFKSGLLTSADIEDILAYAAYRISRKGSKGVNEKSEDALPPGDRGRDD